MWNYEKRLQYPVKIKNPDPKMAMVIISQFGGPDGELAASMRYLSQRYVMPYREVAGLLTDIGSEASEMFHSEATTFFDAFATVYLHLIGSKFRYTSMFSLSLITILSSSCV